MQNDDLSPLSLRRVEAERNMRRFYVLSLQPTLFGEVSLTRNWGRIGTRGQSLIQTYDDPDVARRAFERLARRKQARGYAEAGLQVSDGCFPPGDSREDDGN